MTSLLCTLGRAPAEILKTVRALVEDNSDMWFVTARDRKCNEITAFED